FPYDKRNLGHAPSIASRLVAVVSGTTQVVVGRYEAVGRLRRGAPDPTQAPHETKVRYPVRGVWSKLSQITDDPEGQLEPRYGVNEDVVMSIDDRRSWRHVHAPHALEPPRRRVGGVLRALRPRFLSAGPDPRGRAGAGRGHHPRACGPRLD